METNPNMRQPADYVAYPGKVDHTTVICVKTPEHSKEEELVASTSKTSV